MKDLLILNGFLIAMTAITWPFHINDASRILRRVFAVFAFIDLVAAFLV